MIPIKRIIKFIKETKSQAKEDHFYKQLFINNPTWNKPDPNDDEILRWGVIQKFLLQIINSIPNDNIHVKPQILDLGCGRGWLTNLLSFYGNVTGLEPVSDVVLYSKKLFPDLDFVHGDSKKMINLRRKVNYDIIVSSEVIEHIPNFKKKSFPLKTKKITACSIAAM